VDILVDSGIAPELICPVCTGILDTPIRTPCSHLFCKACLNEWLARSKGCPQCRANLVSFNSNSEDRLIKNIVGVTKVKCTKFAQGCSWVGPLESLQSHPCSACSCERCPYKQELEKKTAEIAALNNELLSLRAQVISKSISQEQQPPRSPQPVHSSFWSATPLMTPPQSRFKSNEPNPRIATDKASVDKVKKSLSWYAEIICDNCEAQDIKPYYRCAECARTEVDYDLCTQCFNRSPPVHNKHKFVRVESNHTVL